MSSVAGESPSSTCFVYPNKSGVAHTVSLLLSLTNLRRRLPRLLNDFAERGFETGQRVEVLPTGHVYEYGGFFPQRYGDFFRLKILDSRDNESRSLPVSEILRLRPTLRKRPKGKGRTDLSTLVASPIDQLLGVRTAGNTAIFANEVMLLTSRSDFEEYLERRWMHCAGEESLAAPLSELVSWGSMTEAGEIQPADRYQAAGEPLIAVSSDATYVAAACSIDPTRSRVVVIDGTDAVRNLQAYDEIVSRTPTVVIADYSDAMSLTNLHSRGCEIWRLTTDEVLAGTTVSSIETGPLSSMTNAARNFAALTMDERIVPEPHLDKVSDRLARIAKKLSSSEDGEEIRQPISYLYGMLLEIASWYGRPDKTVIQRSTDRVRKALDLVDQLSVWIDQDTAQAVGDVGNGLIEAIENDRLGVGKLEQLSLVLEELGSERSRTAVLVRTPLSADSLANILRKWSVDVPVYAVGTLPEDLFFDHLIVAGWPRATLFEKVINMYTAGHITLIAYQYESTWFKQLTRRVKRRTRMDTLTPAVKARITGLPVHLLEQLAILQPIQTHAHYVDMGPETGSIFDLEGIVSHTRKGPASGNYPTTDARRAKYVGFIGQTYAYLTETHSVPIVSALVRRDESARRIYFARVDEARIGDFLLFRDQGDRDIIGLIAEQIMGVDCYRRARTMAGRWRTALQTLPGNSRDVYEQLKRHGLAVHFQTVRGWLTDPARIGPGQNEDLAVIAAAAGDDALRNDLAEVWDAIVAIRGSHVAAGSRLSELLLRELPKRLKEVGEEETPVDLTLGRAWIVQVEAIAEEYEDRGYTDVNRLLWT